MSRSIKRRIVEQQGLLIARTHSGMSPIMSQRWAGSRKPGRSVSLLLLFLLVAWSSPGCALAQPDSETPLNSSIALSIAQAKYGDWDPVKWAGYEHDYGDVTLYGLEFVSSSDDGLGLEAGVVTGSEDDVSGGSRVQAEHVVAYAGLRQTWHRGRVHPYVAAGVQADRAEVEFSDGLGFPYSDTDVAVGLYVRAGLQVDLDDEGRWFLALDGRYGGIGAEHEFTGLLGADVELDSDYAQIALLLGLRF